MNQLKPIQEVANSLGITTTEYISYGNDKAKLSLDILQKPQKANLILMTAMSPTPAGEGKTTMNIGLSMALNRLGYHAISALREPSLGPVFGMKGGATGGGKATVEPSHDINLHFTGDLHAITSCHNLLSAMVYNHIYHGNPLNLDPSRIVWNRVEDMNDRALRNITVNDVTSSFDITAASEIMAILCLAEDSKDLRRRLSRILVAYTTDGIPVYARDLDCVGSMMVLLKDAIKPNLVQTVEGTPAILHGGPFANIAHGCNSVIATKMACALSDYVVTEAGFGADLGAQKFFDIKAPQANLHAQAIVVVATIKALKYHGGIGESELEKENIEALSVGFKNLKRHVENMMYYNRNVVIALNKFPTDTVAEMTCLKNLCSQINADLVECNVYGLGGEGALELAKKVVELCDEKVDSKALVESDSVENSIEIIAKKIYRAAKVEYSDKALKTLITIKEMGLNSLPVCIAKTQYSFSDNPKLLNAPEDFTFHISELRISSGAGFIVAVSGKTMTMPGLPKIPNAVKIDLADDGSVVM